MASSRAGKKLAPAKAKAVSAAFSGSTSAIIRNMAAASEHAAIAAQAAEASAKAKSLTADATHAVIVTALEQTIATSGVEPLTAVSALQLTQTNMQAAGTLTPAIAAAIAEVLAKVQAAIKVQEGPGAIGPTGGPPISAPGATGGGGGSDYRAA